MKAQHGFLSAPLHSGVESNVIINFANWETAANLAKAIISPDFQEHLKCYRKVSRKGAGDFGLVPNPI